MNRGLLGTGLTAMVVLASAPGAAQLPSASSSSIVIEQGQPPRRAEPKVMIRVAPEPTGEARLRREVVVMESILRRKVEGAASDLTRRIEAPVVAGGIMLSGPARAHGYRLEQYGYFFHVDVPTFSQTFLWSVRVIGSPEPALKSIRDLIASVPDPREKSRLDLALQRIELQLPRFETQPERSDGKGGTWVDPSEAYRKQVTDALMDAMLDHAGPLQVAAEEWLTVAARGAEAEVDLGDFQDDTATVVVLRVKGADLAAFREGRIGRDEAKRRIEVRGL